MKNTIKALYRMAPMCLVKTKTRERNETKKTQRKNRKTSISKELGKSTANTFRKIENLIKQNAHITA